MLTAIQDFVRDSFRPAEGGTLSGFTVGEHTVHVEAGPRALIAGVIRGQCPEAVPQRLASTLEQIHLEYATPLTDFEGDAAPFATATPLLEQNLETVLSTDNAERRGGAWLRWAIPLGVVALVVIGLTTVSWLRWRRAVRVMEAEPGFVVVDASRSWRHWNFRGLKDPMARDPRDVLTAAGISAPAIDASWKPFISLDSSIVAERARRALDTLRQRVDGARVLFDPGSSVVADDDPTVRGLSLTILRLLDTAAAAGASIRIELAGRTDPTGSDATNQSLAQQRVDAVIRRVVAFGVPATVLRGRSLAASQPLSAGDPGEGARINRSVSFEVVVENGTRPPRGQ